MLQAITATAAERGLQAAGDLGLARPLRELHDRPAPARPAIDATETAFKVAAATGISVLGASGDFGSADCAVTDSNPPAPLAQLAVNFPSSSPWVTSVGGTNFTLNAAEPDRHAERLERRRRDPGQRRRRWRQQAVRAAELAERDGRQPRGGRSPTWRCSPTSRRGMTSTAPRSIDCHGRGWATFGGTSAATPLLAGGFALIDELLRRHDKAALGFANPLLYKLGRDPTSAPQVFFDVTTGSNDVGPYIQPSGRRSAAAPRSPGTTRPQAGAASTCRGSRRRR